MAITSQSLRSAESMDDGRKAIEQRLLALGRAHLLLQANWKSAQLREILSSAIAPFNSETPSRFAIQSSNIEAAASAAVPLAMAINELCTNAVKYGAQQGSARWLKISTVDSRLPEPPGRLSTKPPNPDESSAGGPEKTGEGFHGMCRTGLSVPYRPVREGPNWRTDDEVLPCPPFSRQPFASSSPCAQVGMPKATRHRATSGT
jgi:anti-sigma regulatory factor (Ser/Thr protein kinase)